MHIGRHIIQELALHYGNPVVERWRFAMQPGEFARLLAHAERRRVHDVTAAIVRGEEVVVIRKPSYPPGAYRIPSGGVHPEEAFLDGAVREAYEETGLKIEVLRYLLSIHVTFGCGERESLWTSHVLLARPLGGEPQPVDTREVESARWMTWEELTGTVGPLLVRSGLGGLGYRARLHERTRELLEGR